MATLYDRPAIHETFEYYDRPVLFSCHADDQLYLVVLEDETGWGDTWLYVRVSEERYAQIKTGKVDLRDAFKQAEDGFVIRRQDFDNSDTPRLTSWACKFLSDDMLPVRGERLNVGG